MRPSGETDTHTCILVAWLTHRNYMIEAKLAVQALTTCHKSRATRQSLRLACFGPQHLCTPTAQLPRNPCLHLHPGAKGVVLLFALLDLIEPLLQRDHPPSLRVLLLHGGRCRRRSRLRSRNRRSCKCRVSTRTRTRRCRAIRTRSHLPATQTLGEQYTTQHAD
jgi:hypothetical protein